MTPIEFQAFRDELQKVKDKHLTNISKDQRKLILAELIKGVDACFGYPEYRDAMSLLTGGHDRKVGEEVIHHKAP
jgi:hypothetical protein